MASRSAWTPRGGIVLSLLLLATAFAGCLAGETTPVPDSGTDTTPAPIEEGWAERALPFDGDHDHMKAEHHANLSTPNFQLLGWDPLLTDYKGTSAGGYFCGDIGATAEGRRYAAVHSFTTDVAFVIADVTDPAAPKKVGEYILERAHIYDLTVTPDGQHVVLGSDPTDTGPDDDGGPRKLLDGSETITIQPKFRDACTGEVRNAGPEQQVPLAGGAILVGIQDPTNPVFEDFRPLPVLGPHSIEAADVDGETIIVASVTNLVHSTSYFHFLEIQDTPAGPKLVLISTYQAPPQPAGSIPVINGHVDANIQKHPVTGQVLAYLANWDAGLVIVDITNPLLPQEIGSWTDFEGGLGYLVGAESGAIHEAVPIPELWDGKHYVLAGQEIITHPSDRPTGWVNIIDTTDPTNPTLVGRWTLPVDVNWEDSLQFSTHYVHLVNRTMFVTVYHGGVWAVDLSKEENLKNPPSIGVFLPNNVSPNPPPKSGGLGDWAPTVLDVLPFPNGDIAVFDGPSGVYMVRFDETNPAPPPKPWDNGL